MSDPIVKISDNFAAISELISEQTKIDPEKNETIIKLIKQIESKENDLKTMGLYAKH